MVTNLIMFFTITKSKLSYWYNHDDVIHRDFIYDTKVAIERVSFFKN